MSLPPFSQACENNKQAILSLLTEVFSSTRHVLEVGSGTGQHAVFFAQHLPHLIWQTSDLTINHDGINAWIAEYPSPNLVSPLALDVTQKWPCGEVDGIFTANTLHIMAWSIVALFFAGVAENLQQGGRLVIYGPFKYQGCFTSDSNADFDCWLKAHDPARGVRDIEAILALAATAGLTLLSDTAMPANNQLLVFEKTQS
ncbi:hypothetical protein PULV_a2424 [Pseudoalteromonas ulvae UL12]|uniref:DUF938 domain-containing protein n=1 Tax=Pseudoalteromonas ulvae TaxID=107327 RepID=UPI00186BAF5F|nr:DUF938 domain-containing protein [Pseudoalteromonas ulvae]MBE0364679.1 hypothetical protein [Pseudoalteromonas ulvae UL12]